MNKDLTIPLGSAASAVDAYRAAGGVIEFVLVDASDSEDPHRTAACEALAEIERRHEAWVAERIAAKPSLKRKQFPKILSRPADAIGEPVGLERFVGRGYDPQRKRLETTWTWNEEGTAASRIGSAETEYTTDGYAEAFTDPPYGMRADIPQLTKWFNGINDELFGGLRDDLEIVSWSTDWSTWFDAGHEWWGAFLWTINPPDRPWVVAVAASTTD